MTHLSPGFPLTHCLGSQQYCYVSFSQKIVALSHCDTLQVAPARLGGQCQDPHQVMAFLKATGVPEEEVGQLCQIFLKVLGFTESLALASGYKR